MKFMEQGKSVFDMQWKDGIVTAPDLSEEDEAFKALLIAFIHNAPPYLFGRPMPQRDPSLSVDSNYTLYASALVSGDDGVTASASAGMHHHVFLGLVKRFGLQDFYVSASRQAALALVGRSDANG